MQSRLVATLALLEPLSVSLPLGYHLLDMLRVL